MLNAMGTWLNRRDVYILIGAQNYIRSAYVGRAALKTRHWRVFFTLRVLTGSNPSSSAVFACKGL